MLADAAWRDVAVLDAAHVRVLPELPGIPPSYHLGVLGMPGLTAWVGLFRLAEFREGDAVFVSGAAGAVGQPRRPVRPPQRRLGGDRQRRDAGEGALADRGARVHRGVRLPRRPGRRAARSRRTRTASTSSSTTSAASTWRRRSARFNEHGRAALCGAISGYNAVEPQPGPRNMFMLVTKKLSLRGFIVGDHTDLHAEFLAKVTQLVTLRRARRPRDGARGTGATPCPRSSTSCAAATPGRWSSGWPATT